MTKLPRGALSLAFAGTLLVGACGGGGSKPGEGAKGGAPLSEAEFVAQADQICADVSSRFGELNDPDGEGGAKPIGLGGFIRDWNRQLRTLAPPAAVADDWTTALDLLDQSADKLDQAENVKDAKQADALQSEALFELQAQAQEHINAMKVPFKACFK